MRKPKQTLLKKLETYVPAIETIIDQANHVAVYPFINQSIIWQKPIAEGQLFMVKRNGPPYYAAIVLSQQSKQSFFFYLDNEENVQMNGHYINYTVKDGSILSIWVNDQANCEKIMTQMKIIHTRWPTDTFAPVLSLCSTNVDMFTMKATVKFLADLLPPCHIKVCPNVDGVQLVFYVKVKTN